jgi:hypothetical protein
MGGDALGLAAPLGGTRFAVLFPHAAQQKPHALMPKRPGAWRRAQWSVTLLRKLSL